MPGGDARASSSHHPWAHGAPYLFTAVEKAAAPAQAICGVCRGEDNGSALVTGGPDGGVAGVDAQDAIGPQDNSDFPNPVVVTCARDEDGRLVPPADAEEMRWVASAFEPVLFHFLPNNDGTPGVRPVGFFHGRLPRDQQTGPQPEEPAGPRR